MLTRSRIRIGAMDRGAPFLNPCVAWSYLQPPDWLHPLLFHPWSQSDPRCQTRIGAEGVGNHSRAEKHGSRAIQVFFISCQEAVAVRPASLQQCWAGRTGRGGESCHICGHQSSEPPSNSCIEMKTLTDGVTSMTVGDGSSGGRCWREIVADSGCINTLVDNGSRPTPWARKARRLGRHYY